MAQSRNRKGTGARKRSSSGANRSAQNAARGRAAADERARIRLEITAIALIAVGAFLLFALFSSATGVVGAGLDNILSGLFGPMAKALPFFLIAYGVLLVIGMIRGADLKRSILIAVIFIMFCALLAGRFIEVTDGVAAIAGSGDLALVFSRSAAGSGGGVVGTYIALGLVSLIGKPGLYILCIALICISGILLAGMSLAMATRVVREKTLSAREERQHRLEERRELYAEDSEDFQGRAASPRRGSFGQGAIQIPTFLGGGKSGEAGKDKQQNILDAVKNDATYGDHTKARGLEIEDTNIPFIPDEPVKVAPPRSVLATAGADLGKRPEGSMKYGLGQDDANYKLPPIDLLPKGAGKTISENPKRLEANAAKLEQALRDFGVEARVLKVTVGPTVTRYEVEPDIGVKIQSIKSLEPDLALKMGVNAVRVIAMADKSVLGIEARNENTSIVPLRDMIDSDEFRSMKSKISFALGKTTSGKRIIVDLGKMPHLLIAGRTGAGKSVCINSILLSILYRAKPSEVKLILIDPKIVELDSYNDLPHLLVPVITEPERAGTALSFAVSNMEDRYRKFKDNQVNELEMFNAKMRKEGRTDEILPYIVIVIDELNDLMSVAREKVETPIVRIAQKARAAGIHLIVATQNPVVSCLTGMIKNNIPARIAFAVMSNTASRVILDTQGAELLSGAGDMLFAPAGPQELIRIQGAYIPPASPDIKKVVDYVKKQMDPDYSTEAMVQMNEPATGRLTDDEDEFFMEAVEMLAQSRTEPKQVSVSMLQRRFRIGYNRAARLVDMMEERGIVAASDGTNKPRRLIISEAQLAGFLSSAGQPDYEQDLFEQTEFETDPYEEDEEDGVTFDSLETLDQQTVDWDTEDEF